MPLRPELQAFNDIKHLYCCPVCEGWLEPNLTDDADPKMYVYCTDPTCKWKQTLGVAALLNISDIAHTLTERS